jgi:hypothetical protein
VTDDAYGTARRARHRPEQPASQGRLGGRQRARSQLPRSWRVIASGDVSGFVPAVSASIANGAAACSAIWYWFGGTRSGPRTCFVCCWPPAQPQSETDLDLSQGRALEVMLQAVTQVSTTYPGLCQLPGRDVVRSSDQCCSIDIAPGTVAQSLAALSSAAQGVRDQSLRSVDGAAEIERAARALAANTSTRACN